MTDTDQSAPPLKAIYDLRYAPITFDFAIFLALTDCARQLLGRTSIDLIIRAGKYRLSTLRDKTISLTEKEWRLNSIILACCELLPSIVRVDMQRIEDTNIKIAVDFPVNYPAEYNPSYNIPYFAAHVLNFYNRGANPKVFRAPIHAKQIIKELCGESYITLTLRTSRHFKNRNVEISDWHRFYKYLDGRGFHVLVVPDQEDVLSDKLFEHYDWRTYVPATLDLRLRFALYEGAKMNICSSNGPAATMFFSNAPVMQFDQLRANVFSAEAWKALNGFPVGENFPWASPLQKLVWKNSSYDTLVNEFELMESNF